MGGWGLGRGGRVKVRRQKTMEAVDRHQNNQQIKALSPRHCVATSVLARDKDVLKNKTKQKTTKTTEKSRIMCACLLHHRHGNSEFPSQLLKSVPVQINAFFSVLSVLSVQSF